MKMAAGRMFARQFIPATKEPKGHAIVRAVRARLSRVIVPAAKE